MDLGLGLIFGGMFGITATGDSERYSKYGQIRDDVERSMRYWHLDKVLVRFMDVAVHKTSPPGVWKFDKGGISACYTATGYQTEMDNAMVRITEEFSQYMNFPKAGAKRIPKMGFSFKRGSATRSVATSSAVSSVCQESDQDLDEAITPQTKHELIRKLTQAIFI